MERRFVAAPWRPPPRPDLRLCPGERVRVGGRSDEWPAFRWCVNRDGTGGWVPEEYLGPERDGEAAVQHAYSSRELRVDPGDEVVVLERIGGWCRCEGPRDTGWVPERVIAPDPAP